MFYIAFSLYYISTSLRYTLFMTEDNSWVFDNIRNLSYVIAGISIILGLRIYRNNFFRYFSFSVLIVLLVYGTIVFGERVYFPTILFGMALPKSKFDNYLKLCEGILLTVFIVTLFSNALGIIEQVQINADNITDVGIQRGLRSSLGFIYAGQVLLSLIPIIFLNYYLHRNKKHYLVRNIVWISISTWIYLQSKTTTPYLIILLFIIAFNIDRKKKRHFFKHKHNYMVILGCAISLISEWLYIRGNTLMHSLDYFVSGRLSTSARVIKRVGIHLLGSNFTNGIYHGDYQYLDADYMMILVRNGVITFIVLMIIYDYCINWCRKNNFKVLELTFSMYLILGLIDNGMFTLYFNPFIILMVRIIIDKSTKRLIERNSRKQIQSFHNASQMFHNDRIEEMRAQNKYV